MDPALVVLITFHAVALICGALTQRFSRPTKLSLRSMTRLLAVELLAIVTMDSPVIGSFSAGYFLACGPVYYKNAQDLRCLLYWVAFNVLLQAVMAPLNLYATLNSSSIQHTRILNWIDFISPTSYQISAMVFPLSLYLREAQHHVQVQKETQARSTSRDISKEEPKSYDGLSLCLLSITLAAGVALCKALTVGLSNFFLGTTSSFLLVAIAVSFVVASVSLHRISRFFIEQIFMVIGNLEILERFVERTLPDQTLSEKPLAITETFATSASWAPLPSSELSGEMPHFQGFEKTWWEEWHFIRTDFLDEQFGLDALLTSCGLVMLATGIRLMVGLFYYPTDTQYIQMVFAADDVLTMLIFGGCFVYLSWLCIKVNDIYVSLLRRVDFLIAQEWRQKGYQNIPRLRDAKASIEAEGPPHTFLGRTLSWQLVIAIMTPLLAPVLAKLWNVLQEVSRKETFGHLSESDPLKVANEKIKDLLPFNITLI